MAWGRSRFHPDIWLVLYISRIARAQHARDARARQEILRPFLYMIMKRAFRLAGPRTTLCEGAPKPRPSLSFVRGWLADAALRPSSAGARGAGTTSST